MHLNCVGEWSPHWNNRLPGIEGGQNVHFGILKQTPPGGKPPNASRPKRKREEEDSKGGTTTCGLQPLVRPQAQPHDIMVVRFGDYRMKSSPNRAKLRHIYFGSCIPATVCLCLKVGFLSLPWAVLKDTDKTVSSSSKICLILKPNTPRDSGEGRRGSKLRRGSTPPGVRQRKVRHHLINHYSSLASRYRIALIHLLRTKYIRAFGMLKTAEILLNCKFG